MFNLVNFCKFFASKKIITTGSRASVGTMKRTADDRIYFSILGQKIELIYDGAEWQPATPDLFGQEEQQEQAQEEQQEQEQLEEAKVFAGAIYYHMFERDLCANGANLVGTAFLVSDRFTNFIAREFLHMKKLIPFV